MTTEGFDPYTAVDELSHPPPDVDALLTQLHERHGHVQINVWSDRVIVTGYNGRPKYGSGSSLREALQKALEATPDGLVTPEGDMLCGVVHTESRATCIKRRGHDGSHANTQGTWVDGPWCQYPEEATP